MDLNDPVEYDEAEYKQIKEGTHFFFMILCSFCEEGFRSGQESLGGFGDERCFQDSKT